MLLRQIANLPILPRAIAVLNHGKLGRRFLCVKKFPSILTESTVSNPFADPSRIRQKPILDSIPQNDETVQAKQFHTTSTSQFNKTFASLTDERIREENKKPVLDSIPPNEENKLHATSAPETNKMAVTPEHERTKEEHKLSDMEELSAMKESVRKLQAATGEESQTRDAKWESGKQFEEDEADRERRRQRKARSTKIGGIVVVSGFVVGGIAFCLNYGRATRDEHGNVITDDFSDKGLLSPFYRIANGVKQWRDYVLEPAREKLLPDPLQAPYLQPKYTLVLEMKNVLVAPVWTYKTGYRFIKRPALDYFLDVVGYPNFEVVIYSSESNLTGPPVVDSFDPKQRIMFKLFRDCTKYMDGHHVKDLSKLNRDLSKVIFIDFDTNSFKLNPENALRIPKWDGDMNDTSLVDLAELLKTIHLSDTDDVRPTLQYYSNYDNPAKEFRKRAVYLQQQEAEKKHNFENQDQSLIKRYSGRFFGFKRHTAA